MAVKLYVNDSVTDVGSTAETILATLRQVAEVAKRNDESAKAEVARLRQQLERAQRLIALFEQRVEAAEDRCEEAEGWLERVFETAHHDLLVPLTEVHD